MTGRCFDRALRRAALLLSTLILAAAPAAAWAQNGKFFFSAKPKLAADNFYETSIDVRPNTSVPLYLHVRSPQVASNAYVELVVDDRVWARSAPLKFDAADQTLPVTFPKPEEKKPAPVPVPVAPPAANAPPPLPPPPPGRVLPFTKPTGTDSAGSFRFTLRLMNEGADKKVTEVFSERIGVNVLQPESYLAIEGSSRGNNIEIKVSPKPNDDTARKAYLDGSPSVVSLYFPPGENIDVKLLGTGMYRRTLTGPGATVTLEATELPIVTAGQRSPIRFYIDVDGFPRAFVFQPTVSEFTSGKLQPTTAPAVRLYPGQVAAESPKNYYVARPVTKPEDRFPVRVELDNAKPETQTTVSFGRTSSSAGEVDLLYGPRDTKVWIDVAAEDGQFLVSNKLTDWVTPLDTYMLRGEYTLIAKRSDQGADKKVALLLDDTSPNRISLQLPDEHVKGDPLRVVASISDRERTPITRVVFFIGLPPGPDGKRAADPVKVEGLRDPADPERWVADLPLAPDAKGVLQVGATATNEVGLDSTDTKNIRLLEPPAPAGTIVVTVLRGGRPQPGVNVLLRDSEGKDKGVLTTAVKADKDKKVVVGQVVFDKLPPGLYGIGAAKADSSSGSKAAVPVKVEAGKTVEINLELKRGP
jgi:hypothetical protein